nr:DUF3253 domain-containing protein [uncultured Jannaschia sp.]
MEERRILEEVRRPTRIRAPGTICPSEVARALRPKSGAWRDPMPTVRRVAAGLPDDVARQGGRAVNAVTARGPRPGLRAP